MTPHKGQAIEAFSPPTSEVARDRARMARESPGGRGGRWETGLETGLRRGTKLTVGGGVVGLAQVMGVSVINLSAWV